MSYKSYTYIPWIEQPDTPPPSSEITCTLQTKRIQSLHLSC